MVNSLEIGIPCVEWIRLVGRDRRVPIEQIERRVCRTRHGEDLYPCDQVAGCAIVFFDFPLELRSPPRVSVKADIKSVGIGYMTAVGNGLKRRISDAYQYCEIGLCAGNLGMVDRHLPLACIPRWACWRRCRSCRWCRGRGRCWRCRWTRLASHGDERAGGVLIVVFGSNPTGGAIRAGDSKLI